MKKKVDLSIYQYFKYFSVFIAGRHNNICDRKRHKSFKALLEMRIIL